MNTANTAAPPPDAPADDTVTRDEFLSLFGTVFENRLDLAAQAWDSGGGGPPSQGAAGHPCLPSRRCCAASRPTPASSRTAIPDLVGPSPRPPDLTRICSASRARPASTAGRRRRPPVSWNKNRAYRDRFGLPFIMAVKGRQPAEVLAALETRLRNGEKEERAEALRQVERILLLRLKDRLGEA